MKYHIEIEGGFAGISKTLEGELDLSPDEKSALLRSMEKHDKRNEKLRDAFGYTVSLIDGERQVTANFDDTNLPKAIRNILTR